MTGLRIVDAEGARLERWDEDVERAINGTLFHLRRFLGYHGDRFAATQRFLLFLDGDSLVAQLPVSISDGHLRSPFGASYGGFALQRQPSYSESGELVEALLAWLDGEGVTRATITPPIGVCAEQPLDVLHFVFMAAGFRSVNRDISSVVKLDSDVPAEAAAASRARNAARRAERAGVTVHARATLDEFWPILESTFERHGATPTHTREELYRLMELLPDRIRADVAYHEREPVAGVVYFAINDRVDSSFYLAQRPDRRELNGLTLCVLAGLDRARSEGFRWFDFGTSTAGMAPRENLFRFKEQFGAIGQFRETFEWNRR